MAVGPGTRRLLVFPFKDISCGDPAVKKKIVGDGKKRDPGNEVLPLSSLANLCFATSLSKEPLHKVAVGDI